MFERVSPSSQSVSAEPVGVHEPATPCNNTSSVPRPSTVIRSVISGLSPKQQTAMELMLQGLGDLQVAERLGIERTTVYRWRTKPGPFRKRLARYRREVWKQQADRMRGMVQPALEVLQKQLTNTDDPRLAMRAAAILLRFAAPGRKAMDEMENEPNLPRRQAAHDDEVWQKLKAQIDAPLPGESACERRGRGG